MVGSQGTSAASSTAKAAAALEEIVEILHAAASNQAPDRARAVRYTECREALLTSPLRSYLPGFLLQCVTVYKFCDFIRLYAPGASQRVTFIDRAFQETRTKAEAGPDIFAEG